MIDKLRYNQCRPVAFVIENKMADMELSHIKFKTKL